MCRTCAALVPHCGRICGAAPSEQHQAPKCNPKADLGESYLQFEPSSSPEQACEGGGLGPGVVWRVAPSSVHSMADPKAALKSRPWSAFFIRPALVCLETCDPEVTTKKKRPQGGFSKPALGCLFHKAGPGLPRDRRPGDNNGKKRPQGDSKKPAMGCLFKWPALVCLETGNPGRRQNKKLHQGGFKKPTLGCLL